MYLQDYVKSNSKLSHLNVSTSTVEIVNGKLIMQSLGHGCLPFFNDISVL